MKKVAVSAALVLTLAGGALATSYLGSIVGSFNATLALGSTRYYPLGLAYDGSDLWAGYSRYAAEWTLTGSRKNTHYINAGINYETAYDQANNRLYAINRLSSVYWILTIDPGSGSITSSFQVPSPLTVPQGLTFGGGYLYIADMYNSRILKTTTTGSVAGSIDPKVFSIKGLAWDGDTSGGPFLFACVMDANHTIHRINPTSGSVVKSFKGPPFSGNIIGLTWDGTYLWAAQNYMGQDMYAFQFIAYDPNVGVTPTTLGKIKALYR
jgi:DNA-binding beta-propeller fold protein YncE